MMALVQIRDRQGKTWWISQEDSDRCAVGYEAEFRQSRETVLRRGGWGFGELDLYAPGWVCRMRDGTPREEFMRSPVYYFGIWPGHRSGHYCWLPNGNPDGSAPRSPWAFKSEPFSEAGCYEHMGGTLDRGGWWTVPRHKPEGVCYHVQREGWTLIACWDLSETDRGGNMSAFAMAGLFTADEAKKKARYWYPGVLARLDRHYGARNPFGEVIHGS